MIAAAFTLCFAAVGSVAGAFQSSFCSLGLDVCEPGLLLILVYGGLAATVGLFVGVAVSRVVV